MTELHGEFTECMVWWVLTFSIGIALREFAKDAAGRWIGRLSVASSCFVLISFAMLSMHRCQLYYSVGNEKHEKHHEDDAGVVQKIADVAPAANLQVKTSAGHTFNWTVVRGWRESMSITDRRARRGSEPGGYSNPAFAGSGDRIDGMPNAHRY